MNPSIETLSALWTAHATQVGFDEPLLRKVWEAGRAAALAGGVEVFVVWCHDADPDFEDGPILADDTPLTWPTTIDGRVKAEQAALEQSDGVMTCEVRPARLVLP